jgi:uncharacterized protein DUF5343
MGGTVPTTYVVATGRIPDYFAAIQKGAAPSRFTTDFLENLGFKAKNDRQFIPLLKALRFLDESNVPTQVYRDYLDDKRAKAVLAKQILAAYEGIFELDRAANQAAAADLKGRFKSLANVSEPVSNWMALTFRGLCDLADFSATASPAPALEQEADTPPEPPALVSISRDPVSGVEPPLPSAAPLGGIGLSYRIEINLPNTTDVEVYRAIFKALREHLAR